MKIWEKSKYIIIIVLLLVTTVFSIINMFSIKEIKENVSHTDKLITKLYKMADDSNSLYEEAKKSAEQSIY